MKKLSLIKISLCVLLATTSFGKLASAKDGVYVGADVILSNVKHKYHNAHHIDSGPLARSVDADNVGAALDAGYKVSFDKVFIAPEIFYDYLNNSAKDFYYTENNNYKQDSLEVNSRYGAKLNFGYNITSKLNGFVNFGVANVKYAARWASTNESYTGTKKFVPIYGLGLSYSLTENWAVRTSYDFQQFYGKYLNNGSKDKISLNVFKIGAVYSF